HAPSYFTKLPPFILPITLFVFTDTASLVFYSLSLHDALPICPRGLRGLPREARIPRSSGRPLESRQAVRIGRLLEVAPERPRGRSEEHTSELQSRENLVCRLLLEKKKLPII